MGWGSSSPRVLVVGADTDVCQSLERGLRLSHFEVATAYGCAAALHSVSDAPPDVVVMDIGIPAVAGVRTLGALREIDTDVPVCVLTAPRSVDDRVAGLEAGADDYLCKPFALGHLVQRLRALLRSRAAEVQPAPNIVVGPLSVDLAARRVRVGNVDVALTLRELELLAVLAQHRCTVLSRTRLLQLVWGYDLAPETEVVDLFIGYLRRKLEAGGTPRLVHTISGAGYMLEVPR